MKEINLEEYKQSIRKCSWNKSGNRPLVPSDDQIVYFDKVKDAYSRTLGVPSMNSVDGLLLEKEKISFIEFKDTNKPSCGEIYLKAYDSCLIYCDIVKCPPREIKKNGRFILVYPQDELSSAEKARADFGKPLCKKAKSSFVLFDISRLAKFPFSEVRTLNVKEFIKEFKLSTNEESQNK